MLNYILEFLGINYSVTFTPELLESILPVLISVSLVFALYVFICLFQFIHKLLNRG